MSLVNSRSSFEVSDCDDACCAAMAACCMNTKDDLTSPSVETPGGNPSSLAMEETQGYDVEFDPPLESKYECPICLMALREPLQTPCGHRFCKACILKSIRDAGPKCPVDNDLLLENQLFPDNFAKREILSLKVKCPNLGCLAKMELRNLEVSNAVRRYGRENHQAVCEFAIVECRLCQQVFQRSQLKQHEIVECPRREVSCENCLVTMPYEKKDDHEQMCPLAYVTCEYCETSGLVRNQMAFHYDMDCIKAPIPCIYSQFGCNEKMQRDDLAQHQQEFTQAHMRMMAQHLLLSFSNSLTSPNHMPSMPLDPSQFEPGPPSIMTTPSALVSSSHDTNQEHRQLKETIDQLETRLVKQDHQIRELIAKMETQTTYVSELKQTIRTLEDKLSEVEAQQYNGVFVWRIHNFSAHLKNQEEEKPVVIHSPGFYTGKPGYKLCLRLHLQLPSAPRCANYISLFVHTMQGEYDGLLHWPFQGTIRLSILDQSEGSNLHDQEEVMDTKPDLLAFQRPTMPRNPKGFGYVTFMHLQALRQRMYIKNDILLVRCVVTTQGDLNSPRREGFQPRNTDGTSM